MPARVSITSPPPTAANLARRLRIWLSIVRSVTAKPGPCSRSMIASRLNTLAGIDASVRRIENSVTVSGTSGPAHSARQPSRSSAEPAVPDRGRGAVERRRPAHAVRRRIAMTRATTSRGEKGLTT